MKKFAMYAMVLLFATSVSLAKPEWCPPGPKKPGNVTVNNNNKNWNSNENVNVNKNSNVNRNTNVNFNVNEAEATAVAVNKGVTATNSTVVEGDVVKVPATLPDPLGLPNTAPLPEGQFNFNDDGIIAGGLYNVKLLKKDINAAHINFVWSKLDVTIPVQNQGAKENIEVATDSAAFIPEANSVYVLNGRQMKIYSYKGAKYGLLSSFKAKGDEDIQMSVLSMAAAYKAGVKGADLLLIEKSGANVGGKSNGFNLFGQGIRTSADGATGGGGGVGPTFTIRYFDCALVGKVFVAIK